MKKIFYTLAFLAFSLFVNAQSLLIENFNYPTTGGLTSTSGGNTSGGAWANASGTGVFLAATPSALSYTNYPNSGVGNKVVLTATSASAEDAYVGFTTQTSGTVYTSFLLNVADTVRLLDNASTSVDFFAGVISGTSTSNFAGRVLIRKGSAGNTYQLGIRASISTNVSAQTQFLATNLIPGQTYLVVTAYKIFAGANNDSAYLWVNPNLGLTSAPTPDAATISNFGTDATDIGRFLLRQGAATPNASVSNIRVALDWANAPLPVSWKSFAAAKTTGGNALRWSTASETNNSHFEVERSVDGRNFTAIGRVKGAGNSVRVSNYSFTDADNRTTSSKTVYYRLKQVDFDGKNTLSRVVSVVAESRTGLEASLPNPFNDKLTITFNSAAASTATVTLMDMIGKVYFTSNETLVAGANKVNIETTDMPNGIYFIRVSANGETFTQKVIKK